MKKKDRILNDLTIQATAELSTHLNGTEFIDPRNFSSIIDGYKQLRKDIDRKKGSILSRLGLINKELKANLDSFNELHSRYPELLIEHNETLARSKAVNVGEYINPIEDCNLDEQQLTAISYDVGTRLVIAGAGTGKTTTIVGLVKHLLKSGKASSEEILALSFTNASVDDLKRRVMNETGQRIDANTFHRLGLRIIASARGTVPKITNIKLNEFIIEEIERRSRDVKFVRSLNEFIAYDLESIKNEERFEDNSELIEYLKDNPLITLKGEKVKSFGEADIANCLAMNGIQYTYEAPYCIDTADSRYGQYHPDFHIDGTDIYIEYFGTDRAGNVAKFMIDRNPNAAEEYRNGIEWKRQVHEKYGTRLIELYAYQRSEGTLIDELESKLRSLNIDTASMSSKDILSRTFTLDKKILMSLSYTFTTAILLIKGFGKPWEEVYPRPSVLKDRGPLKRMESALRPIYDAYQSALKENNEIDFEDMINLATGYIHEGKFIHPYKYVIVDEYQDISRSRYNLLAVLRKSKDYHLFCVGDDWQSIYRFNGCDISYILDFEKYWGPSAICRIEKTYRFSGELLRKSSRFICKNNRQHHKNLTGKDGKDSKVVFISEDDDAQIREEIGNRLLWVDTKKDILFLGRYNHDVRLLNGNGFEWKQNISDNSKTITYDLRPDLNMRFMTIHSSKGLQADIVFSINNRTGKYGFPAIREEPIVIPMLLGEDNYQIDEERRLFYVAMTRAKDTVYIVSQNGHHSDFFKEMFPPTDAYSIKTDMICPLCGGMMIQKINQKGHRFYGCSNYHSKGCKFTRN